MESQLGPTLSSVSDSILVVASIERMGKMSSWSGLGVNKTIYNPKTDSEVDFFSKVRETDTRVHTDRYSTDIDC